MRSKHHFNTIDDKRNDKPRTPDFSKERKDEILLLAKNLIDRGNIRNEIGDRLQKLRESLTQQKRDETEQLEFDDRRQDESTSGREAPPLDTDVASGRDEHPSISMKVPTSEQLPVTVKPPTSTKQLPDVRTITLKAKDRQLTRLQETEKRLREEVRVWKELATKSIQQQKTKKSENARDYQLQEEKDAKINLYEIQLATKEKEIRKLNKEMADAQRRLVELKVQLEFHDFKAMSQERYRKQVEIQILQNMTDNTSSQSPSQNDGETSSNQLYTQKLVSDLEELEKRFLEATQESTDRIRRAEEDCATHQARILSLERTIAAIRQEQQLKNRKEHQQKNIPDDIILVGSEDPDHTGLPLSFYKNRVQTLETENATYGQLALTLKWQLEKLQESFQKKERRWEQEMGCLRLKNNGLQTKVSALEVELEAATGKTDNMDKSEKYLALERFLDDNITEISRLEERLRTKEKIIARLRAKEVEIRLNDSLETGQTMDTSQSESNASMSVKEAATS